MQFIKKMISIFLSIFLFAGFLLFPKKDLHAKCCPVVSISNFDFLVNSLLSKLWSETIIPKLIGDFLNQFFTKILQERGVIVISADRVFQDYSNEFYNEYNNLKTALDSKMGDGGYRSWYCHFVPFIDKCKGSSGSSVSNIVLPVFEWEHIDSGDVSKNVVDYAYSLQGDLNYVYTAWSDVKNYKELPEYEKRRIALDISNLEMAKKNLSQQALQNAAFLKALAEMRKKILEMDQQITSTSKYTSDQAIKDLLKIQVIQGMLLNELLRLQADNALRELAYENTKFTEERKRILDEMGLLHRVLSNSNSSASR